MYSIVDSYVYGNVLFDLGVVFLLPCWIIVYLLVFTSPEDEEDDLNDPSLADMDPMAAAFFGDIQLLDPKKSKTD